MDTSLYLAQILNVDGFERIQDSIAAAMQMAIITVDAFGKPITRHSGCTSFCTKVRSHGPSGDLCERCDARGGLEAARKRKPYAYVCHMGIIDLAVPVFVEGHYIGAIMAGQIQTNDPHDMAHLEKVLPDHPLGSATGITEEMRMYRECIPRISMKRIHAAADMLFQLSRFIADEAHEKLVLRNSLHDRDVMLSSISHHLANDRPVLQMENGNVSGSNTRPEEQSYQQAGMLPSFLNTAKQYHPMIQAAITYIDANYAKNIVLEDMATLCRISSSYFSRLFKKSLGCTLPEYVNRKRIDHAIGLLSRPELRISEIAYLTGFEDSGYFVRVFKQYEKRLPSEYRKHSGKGDSQ